MLQVGETEIQEEKDEEEEDMHTTGKSCRVHGSRK
jgi:hypothetical protein